MMIRPPLAPILFVLSMSMTTTYGFLVKRRTFGAVATIGGAAAVGAAVYLQQQAKKQTQLYTPAPNSLKDQTILITGASAGLGLESAKRLAVGGARLILTARSDAKGQAAVQEVQEYLMQRGLQQPTVSYKLLDLNSLESIEKAVASWTDIEDITVLLNNAGVMAVPNLELTVDGLEQQMQSNHLGHFFLTALLIKSSKLKPTKSVRIINVSSEAHKIRNTNRKAWLTPPPTPTEYGAWTAYGQSKLSNILFTQELQRRCNEAGWKDWTVVSLHPGAVATDLGRNMMGTENWEKLKQGQGSFLQTALVKALSVVVKTVEQGATTQVWLAARADEAESSSDVSSSVKGQYLVDCKVRSLQDFATDAQAAADLWKESEAASGVTFDLLKLTGATETVEATTTATIKTA